MKAVTTLKRTRENLGISQAELARRINVSRASVNMAEKNAEDGVQVSLFNVSNRGGIQIGLANNCSDNAEFQLGLFNYNRNGWLPFMVFFNMAGDDNVAE